MSVYIYLYYGKAFMRQEKEKMFKEMEPKVKQEKEPKITVTPARQ